MCASVAVSLSAAGQVEERLRRSAGSPSSRKHRAIESQLDINKDRGIRVKSTKVGKANGKISRSIGEITNKSDSL